MDVALSPVSGHHYSPSPRKSKSWSIPTVSPLTPSPQCTAFREKQPRTGNRSCNATRGARPSSSSPLCRSRGSGGGEGGNRAAAAVEAQGRSSHRGTVRESKATPTGDVEDDNSGDFSLRFQRRPLFSSGSPSQDRERAHPGGRRGMPSTVAAATSRVAGGEAWTTATRSVSRGRASRLAREEGRPPIFLPRKDSVSPAGTRLPTASKGRMAGEATQKARGRAPQVLFLSSPKRTTKTTPPPRGPVHMSASSSSSSTTCTSTLDLVPVTSSHSSSSGTAEGDLSRGNSSHSQLDNDGETCSSLDLCSCCREQVVRLENHYKLLVVRLLKEMAALEAEKRSSYPGRERGKKAAISPPAPLVPPGEERQRRERPPHEEKADERPADNTRPQHPHRSRVTTTSSSPPSVRTIGAVDSPLKRHVDAAGTAPIGHTHRQPQPQPQPVLVPSPPPPSPSADVRAAELITVQLALAALEREVQATKLALRHHVLAQHERAEFRKGNEVGGQVGNTVPQPFSTAARRESGSTDNDYRSTRLQPLVGKPPTVPTANPPSQPPQHQQHVYNVGERAETARDALSSSGSRPDTFTGSHSSPDPIPPPALSPLVDFLLSSLSPSSLVAPAQQQQQCDRLTDNNRDSGSSGEQRCCAPGAGGARGVGEPRPNTAGEEDAKGRTSNGSAFSAATTVRTYSHSRPSPSPSYPYAERGRIPCAEDLKGRECHDANADSPSGTSNSRPSGSNSHSVRTQPSPSPPSPYTGGQRVAHTSPPLASPPPHPAGVGEDDKENRVPVASPGGGHRSSRKTQGIDTALGDALSIGGNSPEKKLHTRTYSISAGEAAGESCRTRAAHREMSLDTGNTHAHRIDDRVGCEAHARSTVGATEEKGEVVRRYYLQELSPEEMAATRRGRTRRVLRKSFGGRSETASTVPASPLSSSEETALLLSLMYPSTRNSHNSKHNKDQDSHPHRRARRDGGNRREELQQDAGSAASWADEEQERQWMRQGGRRHVDWDTSTLPPQSPSYLEDSFSASNLPR